MRIETYDFGRIKIDGKTYTSDVIILPQRVRDSWRRSEGHSLHIDDLGDVISAKPDVLVVGTGYYGNMAVPAATRSFLEAKGIEVYTAKTTEAVREFNELQKNIGNIVAALHLTC
jgi:hypothetical protein